MSEARKLQLPTISPCPAAILNSARKSFIWTGLSAEQSEAMTSALSAFEKDGTLATGATARQLFHTSYDRVMGRGFYRDRPDLQIFESTFDYWIAFDQAVQRRRNELVTLSQRKKLSVKEQRILDRLSDFNILTRFFRTDDGTYPDHFLDYMTMRRHQLLPQLAKVAVDHLEATGEFITTANCQAVLGMTYDQLMGFEYYNRPRATRGKYRAFAKLGVDFWLAFSYEVENRIQQQGTNISQNLTDYHFFKVRFKASYPNINQGKVSKTVLKLYDFYRPHVQAEFAKEALQIYLETGKLITSSTCSNICHKNWNHLMGQGEFGPETGDYYRRYYNNSTQFWYFFELARRDLAQHWPEGVSKKVSLKKQLERLVAFNLLDVSLERNNGKLPSLLAPLFEEHRERRKEELVSKIVEEMEFHEVYLNTNNAKQVSGIIWDKLAGINLYDRRTGARKGLRIFNSPEELRSAIVEEIQHRLLNPRKDRTSRESEALRNGL